MDRDTLRNLLADDAHAAACRAPTLWPDRVLTRNAGTASAPMRCHGDDVRERAKIGGKRAAVMSAAEARAREAATKEERARLVQWIEANGARLDAHVSLAALVKRGDVNDLLLPDSTPLRAIAVLSQALGAAGWERVTINVNGKTPSVWVRPARKQKKNSRKSTNYNSVEIRESVA